MSTEIALDGVEAYKAQAQELKDAWGRNTDLLQQLEAEKLMSHTLRYHLMSKEAELAASQAREVQLQVVATVRSLCDTIGMRHGPVPDKARQVLAIPQDTTAIEEMIAKACEVMRERCAEYVGRNLMDCRSYGDAIRALPGVTLEDLQK